MNLGIGFLFGESIRQFESFKMLLDFSLVGC